MSLLGWEGKDLGAKGMTGIPGFVRHQGFSVLYSEHILDTSPLKTPAMAAPTSPGPGTQAQAHPSPLLVSTRLLCPGVRRRWVTYRYYGRGGTALDESLGELVSRICATALDPCHKSGCHTMRAHHDMRWIHAGTRVIASVSPSKDSQASQPSSSERDVDAIQMWESCAMCGKQSEKKAMLDGT